MFFKLAIANLLTSAIHKDIYGIRKLEST
jgi:hypothetical protein